MAGELALISFSSVVVSTAPNSLPLARVDVADASTTTAKPTTTTAMADEPSEVEKLKMARREAAAAKRAAAEAAGETAVEAPTAPAVEAPPPAAPTPSGPLQQLDTAETKLAALETELTAVEALLASAADAEAIDAASTRASGCTSVVGQLQGLMDDLDLGELDDDARTAARARRKKINAKVGDEGDLTAAAQALRGKVVAARKKLG